jgi:uncharacterized protein
VRRMTHARVIDGDGHVAEPWEIYSTYIDPEFRDRVPRRVDVEGRRWVIVDGQVYPDFVRYGRRPLGGALDTGPLARPVQHDELANGGVDSSRRLRDMDTEGIDVSVLFPSGVGSMCAVQDTKLEVALYRAYHRWLSDYCNGDLARLRGVAVVCMREPEFGALELHKIADEPWLAGVMFSPHVDSFNLDAPVLDPLWCAAQELDLPVCIHAACGRPPYALGTEESSDNLFLMHAMAHPFEQMRALAACVGGGVLDRFPRLRVAFLEAGAGWMPWWLARLEEHAEGLPRHVPLMQRSPFDYVRDGQIFVACESDEPTLEAAIELLGDNAIIYASDYPHWDCGFPDTVRRIADHGRLSDASKQKILGDNAARLYPRLA